MSRPKLVVMAGGSASGKTTLARRLSEALGEQLLLIDHDRYYRDLDDPDTANFDHPDALETDLLVRNLDDLLAGRPAELPVYEFKRHRRAPHTQRVEPRPIVVVEGILTLAHAPLVQRADLAVYVDTPADIRLARRVRRDLARRGRHIDGVLDRYLTMVRPGHLQFVEPSKAWAQLVLDGSGRLEDALTQLEDAVRRLL